jgi:hypothetical protein
MYLIFLHKLMINRINIWYNMFIYREREREKKKKNNFRQWFVYIPASSICCLTSKVELIIF